jgi:CheY-like chemotaxis protein
MRVLCVGRHIFLSEHLCRFFREVGAECEPAVGAADALRVASRWEPHVVVSDYDLLSPALLDTWASEPALASVPVLAVSLTRRPEDSSPVESSGPAAVVYLPGLDREQALALLNAAHRSAGVSAPLSWNVSVGMFPASVR